MVAKTIHIAAPNAAASHSGVLPMRLAACRPQPQHALTALQTEDLILFYQPKLSMRNHNVIGVEALVRWEHAGVVQGPQQLIAAAESEPAQGVSLMRRLTFWVLREAVKQASIWHAAGRNIPVAINVPPDEFSSSLLQLLRELLVEYALPPSLIELEVTESSLCTECGDALLIMHKLACMGVRIALDDFGTGHSSLVRLKTFPIQSLKIDRAFVQAVDHAHIVNGQLTCKPAAGTQAEKDLVILCAIVSLAKSLRLISVVEGVETAHQLNILRALDVDCWQGFYASPALPADKLPDWIADWQQACHQST